MHLKKTLLAVALLTASAPSLALVGLSVGANGGATRLSGSGSNEYGYEYGVHASYGVGPFLSLNAGYTTGEGKVNTSLSAGKQTVKYTTIPVTLRFDFPLIIGDVYARAGANYYDVDHNPTKDDGIGFTGGAGFVLTIFPLVDFTIGYEYRDMGKLTTDSIVLSAGIGI